MNPALTGEANTPLWKFLGILFGVAIRTKKPLDLHLAPCIWKLIAGMELKVEDLEEVGHEDFVWQCTAQLWSSLEHLVAAVLMTSWWSRDQMDVGRQSLTWLNGE